MFNDCFTSLSDLFFFFFFNDTATTEIYTLSLHDALPTWLEAGLHCLLVCRCHNWQHCHRKQVAALLQQDRKSTRLNSSHLVISYAVFCLKKKKENIVVIRMTLNQNTQHVH